MAVSRYVLKTLAGIERPAIATVIAQWINGYTSGARFGRER